MHFLMFHCITSKQKKNIHFERLGILKQEIFQQRVCCVKLQTRITMAPSDKTKKKHFRRFPSSLSKEPFKALLHPNKRKGKHSRLDDYNNSSSACFSLMLMAHLSSAHAKKGREKSACVDEGREGWGERREEQLFSICIKTGNCIVRMTGQLVLSLRFVRISPPPASPAGRFSPLACSQRLLNEPRPSEHTHFCLRTREWTFFPPFPPPLPSNASLQPKSPSSEAIPSSKEEEGGRWG